VAVVHQASLIQLLALVVLVAVALVVQMLSAQREALTLVLVAAEVATAIQAVQSLPVEQVDLAL
jgi:hypothetical protein